MTPTMMHRMRTGLCAFTLIAAAAACGDLPSAPADSIEPAFAKGGPKQPPTSGGRIFFSSFMTGNWDIFSVNPDGTDLRRLTFSPEHETYPEVSPDGKKVVYNVWGPGGSRDIWIMNTDGSRQRPRLTQPADVGQMYPPTWSPDGRTITFSYQQQGTGRFRMANIGTNSGDPVLLPMDGRNPTWSPDGQYLAYVAIIPGDNEQLVTSRADGTDLVQRTSGLTNCCGSPKWSPDGGRVLYYTWENGAGTLRFAGITTSSGGLNLTVPTETSVAWSPDGTRIAYDGVDNALRVVLANNGANTAILEGISVNFGISWSR